MSRMLVPTLALLALAGGASAATADTTPDARRGDDWLKPELRFGGSIEALADLGADSVRNDPTTSVNEDGWYADFNALADITLDVRFTDRFSGRADVWIVPSDSGSTVMLRDGYIAYGDNDWTAKGGKMIRPLGFLSPRQDQQYRVWESTIGYTGATGPFGDEPGIFGGDPIGVSLTWHRDDVPVAITGMLTNGFWNRVDLGSGTRSQNGERERHDLGYAVDGRFTPNHDVVVDGQIAFQPHSYGSFFGPVYVWGIDHGGTTNGGIAAENGYNSGTMDRGGSILFLDLNALVKPLTPLTLGAEIAHFSVGDGDDNGNRISNSGYSRLQALAMANWAFVDASFPTSVTGMVQHIQDSSDTFGQHGRGWELSAALLTQPFHRVPLHLDAELAYQTVQSDFDADSHGIELSGRALLTF